MRTIPGMGDRFGLSDIDRMRDIAITTAPAGDGPYTIVIWDGVVEVRNRTGAVTMVLSEGLYRALKDAPGSPRSDDLGEGCGLGRGGELEAQRGVK